MILDLVKYPDKLLYQKSLEVVEFDENLHKFLDDMYETMVSSNGIGLAAVQVGELKRIFIINIPEEEKPQVKSKTLEVINPKITPLTKELECYQEGCLSVPGYFDDITRPNLIRLEYQDRFGKPHTLEATGLLAVAIQHENDHLEGHLFIEKLGYKAKKNFQKFFKESTKNQSK